MTLEIGAPAPDFTLKDQFGQEVKLSDFAGEKNVVLVFVPFAFTGICTGELCEMRDNLGAFEAADVQVIAVSCDPTPSQRVWADKEGYTFPVLSDFWPHGKVASMYGVLRADGVAERALIIIDKKGIIRYMDVHDINKRPPLEDLVKELEKLK